MNGSKLQASTNNANKTLNLNQTKQSDTKSKKEASKLNASQMSDVSTVADSSDNLIKRLEELRTENEEIRLNLRAEQEITDKLQEEIDRKNQEITDLGNARSALNIFQKKYEELQSQFEQYKGQTMSRDLTSQDKDIKVAELQIMNKNQLNQMKLTEGKLREQLSLLEQKYEDADREAKRLREELKITSEKCDRLQGMIKIEQISKENLQKEIVKTQRDYEIVNKKFTKLDAQQL